MVLGVTSAKTTGRPSLVIIHMLLQRVSAELVQAYCLVHVLFFTVHKDVLLRICNIAGAEG